MCGVPGGFRHLEARGAAADLREVGRATETRGVRESEALCQQPWLDRLMDELFVVG